MARIKKLKENGKTVYPPTILQAVVDPSTGKTLKTLIDEMNTALTKVNALTLKGHGVVEASETDPRNRIPVVGTDMVMETGRYLDFHYSGTGGKDYDIRLACNSQNQNLAVNLPTHSGTLATLSDIPGTNYVYGCFDNVDTYVDLSTLPKSTWSSQAPVYFVSEDTEYQRFCFFLNYHFDSDNNTVSAYFVANDLDGAGIGLYYFENKKATSNNVRFDFKAI